MDVELEKRINDAIAAMQQILPEAVDIYQLDPMAKIMLVALVSETSKIQDYAEGTLQRIVERFCTDFIPRKNVSVMPAVRLAIVFISLSLAHHSFISHQSRTHR